MGNVKYIVVEDPEFGHECIIVFSKLLMHSTVGRRHHVISAGFIRIGIGKDGNPHAQCWGKSVSLKIDSRPEEDTKLANKHLGLTYE